MRLPIRPAYLFAAIACLMLPRAGMSAASTPLNGVASGKQFMLVLDPLQPSAEVLRELAAAGFPSVQTIAGLPARYLNYRLIEVAATDEATKTQLLAVPGVRAVRSVLTSPFMKEPVLLNGQVIVKFKPGTPQSEVQAVAARSGCTIARQMGVLQTYVFDVDESTHDALGVPSAIGAESSVVYCQPSILFKLKKHALSPIEDPLYPFQWHLRNIGQLRGATPGADIKAVDAWEITMGSGAVVAVVDDCLQRDHEDLKANYLTGYDFLGSAVNPTPPPVLIQDGDPSPYWGPDPTFLDSIGEGHGTCVAGIIAAAANTIGVRGVAPQAKLIGCKIGLGYFYTSDQDVADAYIFCEATGAMAVNNSWGGPGGALLPVVPSTYVFPTVVSDAIQQIATTGRGGKGVLVLFSSGNESIPLEYGNRYAALPEVMAIGATLRNDLLSCYSNYGDQQSVVAPGGGVDASRDYGGLAGQGPCFEADITTTDVMEVPGHVPYDFLPQPIPDGFPDELFPCRGFNPPMKFLWVIDPYCTSPFMYYCVPLVPDLSISDFPDPNYTQHMNGTSAACPVATGVAALVFSMNSNLTAEQVRNLMEHTADKVQAPNEEFDTVTGHNVRYGHGRVNALRAVQAAQAARNWPSPVKDVQNVSSQTLVRLFWTNPENDCAGILVARSTSELNWAPADGIAYRVGQQVAPGIVIVASDLIDRLDEAGLPTGSYHYAIFVRNGNNFYSWGRRTSFSAQGTTKPLASISVSPGAGGAPLKVHFAGGAIDKNGIVAYQWNFGDGTTGAGAAIDHTYTQGGTYMATLTVVSASGLTAQASTPITVSGRANAMPSAVLSASPTSGTAPLIVLFQGAGTDSDGVIVRYDWDFGDGNTASGSVIEHTYIAPGTYGAALTVTDDLGGTGTAMKVITVTSTGTTAAATEPPGLLEQTRQCGTGLVSAAAASGIGLLLMRRRR